MFFYLSACFFEMRYVYPIHGRGEKRVPAGLGPWTDYLFITGLTFRDNPTQTHLPLRTIKDTT